MWERLKRVWPNAAVWRKTILMAGAVGVVVMAFSWGRWGALSEATATTPETYPISGQKVDYAHHPVAYLYNSIPITREELGEYLIARYGAERLEFLVNRRIIERTCQLKGIQVSDAEVEAQLVEDLKAMNIVRLEDFVNKVLRRFGKNLYEYKEDVIRPKLALTKLCRDNVLVTEEDLQKGFEARFGPKVHCRMIVLSKDVSPKDRRALWEQVVSSPEAFEKAAREQFIKDLAMKGGDAPPIHKHFGDARVEQAAFSLKPGEVSQVLEMEQDGTGVILKCVDLPPADTTRRLEDERLMLQRDILQIKLAQEIPRYFQQLRNEADPRLFLQRETEATLVRRTNELLQGSPPPAPAPAPAPAGAPIQGH